MPRTRFRRPFCRSCGKIQAFAARNTKRRGSFTSLGTNASILCESESVSPKSSGLKLAAILAAAALILGGTVCAAMNGVFGGRLKSHITENLPSDMAEYPGNVMLPASGETRAETDETPESDSAGISVTCDAVSGGGNVIYINLTVRGSDGQSPLTLSPGRILSRAYSHDASVTFPDGTKKEIQFWKTESAPGLIRFERASHTVRHRKKPYLRKGGSQHRTP